MPHSLSYFYLLIGVAAQAVPFVQLLRRRPVQEQKTQAAFPVNLHQQLELAPLDCPPLQAKAKQVYPLVSSVLPLELYDK